MSVASPHRNWLEANQRFLAEVISDLREKLESYAAAAKPVPGAEVASAKGQDWDLELPPALDAVGEMFGLSLFELGILAMCAGVELDSKFALACAAANGDPRRNHVNFGLALAFLADGHWSALSPGGPLRRWRLVDVIGDSLTTANLRIDERVLHHLTGVHYLDGRLEGLVERPPLQPLICNYHNEVAERAAGLWMRTTQVPWPAILLCGADSSANTAIAQAACRALGLGVLRLNAGNIPAPSGERTALARLCERELALSASALVLVVDVDSPGEDSGRAARFAGEMAGPIVISSAEAVPLDSRRSVRLDIEKLTHDDQRTLWLEVLGTAGAALDGQLNRLVTQFNLDTNGITSAAEVLGTDGRDPSFEELWDSCRVQARSRLEGLAQRIISGVGWEDLVLPTSQLRGLHEVSLHVRHARKVYEEWGFGDRNERGLGITALFSGPSGTGKTLAAEVLANELHLDLYRIDLSQVVSKYIGETEKNMRRIFAAAESSGAVLLFDEADALFGKRSEVKDSHDRYANIEVGYLLQRMEAYRGLAILTTNMKAALDPAFLRRIRFFVQFPFPDAAQREEIWRRAIPAQTPTAALDLGRLARMSVAGGNIRNIAMNAAFLAAEDGRPVDMTHIGRAALSEYAKLDKPLTVGELGAGG